MKVNYCPNLFKSAFLKVTLFLVFSFFSVFIAFAVTQKDSLSNYITKDNLKINIENFLTKNDENLSVYLTNFETDFQFGKQVLQWAETSNSEENLFWAHLLLSKICYAHSNKKEFVKYARQMVKSPYLMSSDLAFEVFGYLRLEYIDNRFYNELFKTTKLFYAFYKKTLGVSDPISESEFINSELALINYVSTNYSKAISSYKATLNGKTNFHKSTVYNNIALAFKHMKQTDSSHFYFRKSLKFLSKTHDTISTKQYKAHFKNVVESNLADAYLETDTPQKAIPYYQNEINSARSFKGEVQIMISGYCNLAQVYYQLKQPKVSLQYLDSSLALLQRHYSKQLKAKALHLKAKNYLMLGDINASNQFFKAYENFIDSVEVASVRTRYLVASVLHETDLKDNELKAKKQQLKTEQEQLFFQRIITLISVLVLIIIAVVALNTKKKNKIINLQKGKLTTALAEREVLLKEIHHRVKNNLQVISGILELEALKQNNTALSESFGYAQNQIQSISLLHNMLYTDDDLAQIDVQTYFKALINEVLGVYVDRNVNCTIQTNGLRLAIAYANPLGLILNELFTNSLKHAFNDNNGAVTIGLTKTNDQFAFSYKDNGSGFATLQKSTHKTHFGQRLITLLVEELNAELDVTSQVNKGVYYQIKFSIKTDA